MKENTNELKNEILELATNIKRDLEKIAELTNSDQLSTIYNKPYFILNNPFWDKNEIGIFSSDNKPLDMDAIRLMIYDEKEKKEGD